MTTQLIKIVWNLLLWAVVNRFGFSFFLLILAMINKNRFSSLKVIRFSPLEHTIFQQGRRVKTVDSTTASDIGLLIWGSSSHKWTGISHNTSFILSVGKTIFYSLSSNSSFIYDMLLCISSFRSYLYLLNTHLYILDRIVTYLPSDIVR